ncbi:hypothetical protein [Desulfobacter postgatei]|nr:hypothetical protein [uncultured Desulfobacter sp.]
MSKVSPDFIFKLENKFGAHHYTRINLVIRRAEEEFRGQLT